MFGHRPEKPQTFYCTEQANAVLTPNVWVHTSQSHIPIHCKQIGAPLRLQVRSLDLEIRPGKSSQQIRSMRDDRADGGQIGPLVRIGRTAHTNTQFISKRTATGSRPAVDRG